VNSVDLLLYHKLGEKGKPHSLSTQSGLSRSASRAHARASHRYWCPAAECRPVPAAHPFQYPRHPLAGERDVNLDG